MLTTPRSAAGPGRNRHPPRWPTPLSVRLLVGYSDLSAPGASLQGPSSSTRSGQPRQLPKHRASFCCAPGGRAGHVKLQQTNSWSGSRYKSGWRGSQPRYQHRLRGGEGPGQRSPVHAEERTSHVLRPKRKNETHTGHRPSAPCPVATLRFLTLVPLEVFKSTGSDSYGLRPLTPFRLPPSPGRSSTRWSRPTCTRCASTDLLLRSAWGPHAPCRCCAPARAPK